MLTRAVSVWLKSQEVKERLKKKQTCVDSSLEKFIQTRRKTLKKFFWHWEILPHDWTLVVIMQKEVRENNVRIVVSSKKCRTWGRGWRKFSAIVTEIKKENMDPSIGKLYSWRKEDWKLVFNDLFFLYFLSNSPRCLSINI